MIENKKELQSLRDMALVIAEKATEMLARERVPPVSTGSTKKSERERFLIRRKNLRLNR